MKCSKCGKNIPDNSQFCTYCGKQIDDMEEKENQISDLSFHKKLIIVGIIVGLVILSSFFILNMKFKQSKKIKTDEKEIQQEVKQEWKDTLSQSMEEKLENLDELQVLIMGETNGLSDTLMILSYNPKSQESGIVSIPKNTFVGNNKNQATINDKINSLYSEGDTPEKTIEAINKITGLNIQYYIVFDKEDLIELVDILGGLEFTVPIDMNYDDPTQNIHINLNAGYQKLTGNQVEQLFTFKHNNDGTTYSSDYGMEEYGRLRTQRNVVIEILYQCLGYRNIKEIEGIIDTIKGTVETNMDLNLLIDYVPYATEMEAEDIKTGIIPGTDNIANGEWFFFYDEEETKKLVDEMF